jgi:hypothetical protein
VRGAKHRPVTKARILDFDPARGLPAGSRIVHSCEECGDRIASMPAHEASCACGNVAVDFDAGRARSDATTACRRSSSSERGG